MSSSSTTKLDNEDIPTLISLTQSNARALYGRHMTYDIITSGSKPPNPAAQRYDGQKVHALLVGYSEADPSKGKLLRGAYALGVGKTAPAVAHAVRLLYDGTRIDVYGFVGKLVVSRGLGESIET